MREYIPARWLIIKIVDESEPDLYKVAASWSGGYASGDSWRINSGIKSVTKTFRHFLFKGYSDSVYKCRKTGYGASMLMWEILSRPQEEGHILVLSKEEAFKWIKEKINEVKSADEENNPIFDLPESE